MSIKYQKSWQAILLLAPTLAACAYFLYLPAVETFRLSMYVTQPGGVETFVGLDNFRLLFNSEGYRTTAFWSFVFAGVIVVGSLSLSLLIGFLIYRVSVGSTAYLVVGMLSYGFSFAVAAVAIQFILQPESGLLHALTGWSFDWLTSGPLAFFVICLATIWKMLGFNLIFILGAFSGIPDNIGDAARLDGVGGFKMLTRVYIPLIAPTLAFLVIMNTVYSFFLPYPVIDIMTSGSPETTHLLIYELYETGIAQRNTGLAAAQSIVLFVIVGALMVGQLVLSEQSSHVGGA
ncbi:carbohydrate ABC transporter permease [Halovenus sp. HT40]|uniref:carbohydrate ABC transporter permease n=1 Tax=Halovenus sp. HT40 TaxID=3126691 RepID=UPI00300E7A5A